MIFKRLPSIPYHFFAYPWYAPHQAWLRAKGMEPSHAVPRGTVAKRADLRDVKISGVDISKMDLSGALLDGVDFSGSNLSASKFFFADLKGANFSDSFLIESRFSNANISHANFSGARLLGADFSGANMREANWDNALGVDRLAGGSHLSRLLSGSWIYVPST